MGLIYGPSGCGKSSLVKAGLLPRLAKSVTAVYVEATGEETEARLLKGLRRQVPDLPGNLGMVESLAALRQGRYLEPGQKVLLVLDQFEQWLHAKRNEENSELVQALRHCDGGRMQCIVMVRDDFWMAATWLMKALEIRLVEAENSCAVDLFDLLHASKVLSAFGQAYGRLPDNLGQCSNEQGDFLDQVITGLAQDGKVISVRLALFAEMVKGKPWVPATLNEVGGPEGIGVAFLDETFTASTAPPQHRLHQKAAQAVLKALLPAAGTVIKGQLRSWQELFEASGYAGRPKDFDDLLRILDSEIRLITPTDPEGAYSVASDTLASPAQPPCESAWGRDKYYQLTHDYLVPSLRDWLTRKQKETRQGRAELLLADRAAVWNVLPENRQLPSLLLWLQIRWLTRKKTWTMPQRKMMRRAARYHALRGMAIFLVLGVLGWGAFEEHGTLQAHALRDRLLDANTADVPTIVQDMAPYRRWVDPLVRDAYAQAEARKDARKQLHASLALLPVDAGQAEYLYGRLLDAEPNQIGALSGALDTHQDALLGKLWTIALTPENGKEQQRLRAAAALARYDPESQHWDEMGKNVTNHLVNEPAVYLETWLESFRPVRVKLLAPLARVYRDGKRRETERSLATAILADYAAHSPDVLVDLLLDADDKSFAVFFPKLKANGEHALTPLLAELNRSLPPQAKQEAHKKLAKHLANAGVALLKMGEAEKVWPLLKHSPNPRTRCYLTHRFHRFEVDAGILVKRLDDESDLTIRRTLLVSLGEFAEKDVTPTEREKLVGKVKEIYRTEADPGLHAAAEWLLRRWKHQSWLKETNEGWTKDMAQRTQQLDAIRKQLPSEGHASANPRWYVNGQGQTMVVLPGPVEFLMGSPLTELERWPNEDLHRQRIGRTFAIAAKPVTVAQFQRFFQGDYGREYPYQRPMAPTDDCPMHAVSWYLAAEYCNWLSRQEGIPETEWCYEPNKERKYADGMKLRASYLSLSGYRLPTEAEWEYACRAGAETSRYYGDSVEFLAKYAYFLDNAANRSWPVGNLKPNDFGLFDMHGNVWQWCQARYEISAPSQGGKLPEDTEGSFIVFDKDLRVLRGGSYGAHHWIVRCAYREASIPNGVSWYHGLRPVKTFR